MPISLISWVPTIITLEALESIGLPTLKGSPDGVPTETEFGVSNIRTYLVVGLVPFGLSLAGCSNMALNRSAVIMWFCFFSFPCHARLALRYAHVQ